ncbi:hypothetical protein SRHO_G00228960 [Serrasalmus rhombeus]
MLSASDALREQLSSRLMAGDLDCDPRSRFPCHALLPLSGRAGCPAAITLLKPRSRSALVRGVFPPSEIWQEFHLDLQIVFELLVA